MWIRILGSAAGGGFPQWNCACPQCRAARTGARPCVPRSQSSIAVSANRQEWFLLNASPDVQRQVESFPDLHNDDGSIGRLQSVLLTDSELDHTAGLLLMREGRELQVHATKSMYQTLNTGTGLLRILGAYCPVTWKAVVPGVDVDLGEGLTYRAFNVPTTKAARFEGADNYGRVVGYRITDTATDRSIVYLPSVQQLTPQILEEFAGCSALLIDGTCWSDDEMPALGLAGKTSRDMGHVPISGPRGSLALISPLPIKRKIYVHINNTNPILLDDSPQRLQLERQAVEVATDGLEIEI
ncbi:pyrroloquinoline quinone biosynthesis protein B [Arthrobacter sp. cf158]|uniref:pyrroloquinoline quinone biosynthesis protein PqqB n=1 Tax=Arthrobacter sp. cf158 TaxID=1761744 RepID=UPI0008995C19|nr:pyrroloquinoline quinone biosynthesis protein PqqB [Arthrobacter sp. cf158]SDX60668.1 pyrroloquinoline quinone biosynthesis protein B [Arthrobacter sp. cf158]